jgi:regulator of protease activity HflC (stomatin/prohibitin superfamily)
MSLLPFVFFIIALALGGAALFSADVKGVGRKTLGGLGVVALLISMVGTSYVSVPAGYRGVLLRFGAVSGVLGEGFHLVTPVIHSVVLMDVRTQKSAAKAAAASKDLQTVQSEVAVNYHISPAEVGNLYKRVGVFYEERVIEPAVQETLKAVVANYTAGNLIQFREKVKAEVDAALSKRLSYYNIQVEPGGVSLTNFDFSAEFNAAIEAKQVAQQDAEKQKYVLNRAQTEAQTAITIAKGEAEANRVKAIALNSSGGQKVLAREWIQKWDGKLPAVSGGNNSNLIDLRSLMAPEPAKNSGR